MKIATEEELAGHYAAIVRGAIEGIAAGLAISLPGTWYMNHRWLAFRSLPIQLKALGTVLLVAPLYAIQAERRGVEYDESTWTGAGKRELEREERRQQERWSTLDAGQKFREWAMRHQYEVILGSWATSMAIAGAIVMRNKHQTTSQKVVQARMWAQGLTIGVLIAAGVLTHSNRQEAAANRQVDHTWVNMVEEFQREEIARASSHP
ncbi:hypothetical protein WOLCODRAFT_160477 [Wolfiporia cocos MD-104 SS10]|uniref:HIG1 domain-containing protein n=1 Tax=Wolfiporia cocos (strain MD-104) TaxID=742152 RepID=A0A2H3IVD1_WOLCO|nr:hypothetical protein WOLCODRAFT_160477 [Wolfiporia cocos MD-104 SS10]